MIIISFSLLLISDDFHKNLRDLLAKIILENLSAWRVQAINNQGNEENIVSIHFPVNS